MRQTFRGLRAAKGPKEPRGHSLKLTVSIIEFLVRAKLVERGQRNHEVIV